MRFCPCALLSVCPAVLVAVRGRGQSVAVADATGTESSPHGPIQSTGCYVFIMNPDSAPPQLRAQPSLTLELKEPKHEDAIMRSGGVYVFLPFSAMNVIAATAVVVVDDDDDASTASDASQKNLPVLGTRRQRSPSSFL